MNPITQRIAPAAGITAILACCLLVVTYLNYCNFEKRLNSIVHSRFMVVAKDLRHTVEYGLNLGLALENIKNIQSLITSTAQDNRDISAIEIRGSDNDIIFSVDANGTATAGIMFDTCNISLPLTNQFGIEEGRVSILYPVEIVQTPLKEIRIFLSWLFLAVLGAFTLSAAILLLFLPSGKDPGRAAWTVKLARNTGSQRFLLLVLLVLLLAATGTVAFLSLRKFQQVLVPEMEKKAQIVGKSVSDLIHKVLDYGVPLEKIRGMQPYLDEIRQEHAELQYEAITFQKNIVMYSSSGLACELAESILEKERKSGEQLNIIDGRYRDISFPIQYHGSHAATLHLGVDRYFFEKQARETVYDVLTVLLISFISIRELLLLIFSGLIPHDENPGGNINTATPLPGPSAPDGTEQGKIFQQPMPTSVGMTRGILFLFIFSAMFPLSFLPISISTLELPETLISREVLLSLPFAAYYACSAAAMAFAGPWSQRSGRKLPMIMGAVCLAAGYAACAATTRLTAFTIWYCLAGIGLGLVMVTCQGHIIDYTPHNRRASAMAGFWAGFFSGSMCGTGTGALIAQHLGSNAALALASLPALLSALLMAIMKTPGQTAPREHRPYLKEFRQLFSNTGFLAVTLGISIPAKLCMTGFMFYLVPRHLAAISVSKSATGRILMIYSLMFVFAGPALARMLEKRLSPAAIVLPASILSGIALLFANLDPQVTAVVIAISIYALLRSASSPASTALLLEACPEETKRLGAATVLGSSLLIERTGNIAGPLLAGTLTARLGMSQAMTGFGVLVAACALAASAILSLNKKVMPPKSARGAS